MNSARYFDLSDHPLNASVIASVKKLHRLRCIIFRHAAVEKLQRLKQRTTYMNHFGYCSVTTKNIKPLQQKAIDPSKPIRKYQFFAEFIMAALVHSFDCSECQLLSSKISEVQARIINAKSALQEAVEAADGTSARKYDELQALVRLQDQVLSEIRAHDGQEHTGYDLNTSLTHGSVET